MNRTVTLAACVFLIGLTTIGLVIELRPKRPEIPFVDAVEQGRLDQVELHVRRGTATGTIGGADPLDYAIEQGNLKLAAILGQREGSSASASGFFASLVGRLTDSGGSADTIGPSVIQDLVAAATQMTAENRTQAVLQLLQILPELSDETLDAVAGHLQITPAEEARYAAAFEHVAIGLAAEHRDVYRRTLALTTPRVKPARPGEPPAIGSSSASTRPTDPRQNPTTNPTTQPADLARHPTPSPAPRSLRLAKIESDTDALAAQLAAAAQNDPRLKRCIILALVICDRYWQPEKK